MLDRDGLAALQARHIGFLAAAALEWGGAGRIGALFERSFYVALGEAWICIGPESLERGPLNLGCALAGGLDWRASGLELGLACHAGSASLRVGQRCRLATAAAEVWAPPPVPTWSRQSLARGLAMLMDLVAGSLPKEGLASILSNNFSEDSPIVRQAGPAIARLRDWLTAAARDADRRSHPPPLSGLIGLGPGLTPSGDDFLCGVVIALRFLGLETQASCLAEAALPLFRSNGNPISTAHFLAAAEGGASAALHDGLAALASGHREDLRTALARLDRLGHTSGWDALAGLVVVLRAVAEARAPGGNGLAALAGAQV